MAWSWSIGSVLTAVAVAITLGSGMVTAAIQWGSTNQQLHVIAQHQADQDARLSKHDSELSDQKAANAAINQKLDDLIQRTDRIEKKL